MYIGDADVLGCSSGAFTMVSGVMIGDDAGGVFSSTLEGISASVATRGIMYGNSHPAKTTWRPLKVINNKIEVFFIALATLTYFL
jgi:hypothetical protein